MKLQRKDSQHSYLLKIPSNKRNVLSRDCVTVDGVWVGNRIIKYLQNVSTNNYDNITELHTPNITVTSKHIKVFSVFIICCLVVASNSGRSLPPSSQNFPGLIYQLLTTAILKLTPQLSLWQISAGAPQHSDSWFLVPRDS
jgi:hypothetical protein